ncbi:MAG: hypothetical protein M1818_000123 [Claussenomyces sp. TS43310]|nr:MAG: hypothetical protein M1818_000123 [Claussenomyces sp. TS43310]
MGATASLVKTLIVPAAISLGLYVLLFYAIVPLWQRYRGRYSRYLPLEMISSGTTTLRARVHNFCTCCQIPSSWRSGTQQSHFAVGAQNESDDGLDLEEGEELFDVDERRRAALSLDARRGREEEGRRLSRDLEEGFRDDSDDERPTADSRSGVIAL